MKVPALYELEPIGVDGQLEANGRVYFFCPAKDCRDVFHREHSDLEPMGFGWDEDYIEGTVCDQCETLLTADPATIPEAYAPRHLGLLG
jgi:hypothetical protein